jgi:glycosyltransferase involved in cell wall biosynthesis
MTNSAKSIDLKVCIVTHSYPRFEGDWRSNFIESLARAYSRNGAQVTVFVPYAIQFQREPIDANGVKIVRYRYVPFPSWHTLGYGRSMKDDLSMNLKDILLTPFLLLTGVVKFAILLNKEDVDLIHAHWAIPNTIIALMGRFIARSKAKVFTSFPGSDVTVITRLGWVGRLFAKMISHSDYLSCNSSDLKEDLVDAGIDKEKIDLVIYGVDDKRMFFSEEERKLLRGSWGISEDVIVLLLIGRFVSKKGFGTAFKSLKYIAEQQKKLTMVVVGDGQQKSNYLDILRADGTESYVKFIGEIPTRELRKYYSACDIFLMPSERLPSDGLNVVVPEAMACGRAVVATKASGNDLVIFQGINGLLIDEKNSKQLADAVIKLIREPELAKVMGGNSLKLIRDRFNWDAIAKYYLERYRDRMSIP